MTSIFSGGAAAGDRYATLVGLGRALATCSDWSQLATCLMRSAVLGGQPAAVRVWGVQPDGSLELARRPPNRELPNREPSELRRAAVAHEPVVTADGSVLVGLHAAGGAVGVVEFDPGTMVDLTVLADATPVIASRFAALAAQAAGGVALASTSCASDVDWVVQAFADQVRRELDHDRMSIYIVTRDGRAVERFAVATSPPLPEESVIVPFSDFGLRLIILTNTPFVCEDFGRDPRVLDREDRVVARAGFHGLLSVPLRINGRPFGVINFVSRTPGLYREEDIPTAERIADAASSFFAYLQSERTARTWIRHEAAELERVRLARDLHTALAAQGGTGDTEVVVRSALAGLVSSPIDGHSLEAAIVLELEQLRGELGLETSFVVEGDLALLPGGACRVLDRVLREATSNVRRHAFAARVSVRLVVGVSARLEIEDDGAGFSPEAAESGGGLGVRIVGEWVRSLGGSFEVVSTPGRGTRLAVDLADLDGIREAGLRGTTTAVEISGPPALRVVVAERHPLVRAGIRSALGREPDIRVVAEAGTLEELRSAAERLRPNVVVLDADLPAATEQVLEIKRVAPTTAVLLCADPRQARMDELLESGASGVVPRTIEPDKLVEAVRAVAGGARLVAGSATPAGAGRQEARLSERELEVLRLVAAGHTNSEIGRTLFMADKTVERVVAGILVKMEASNRAHAAALAIAGNLVELSST